jgi:hypothetical protein
MAEISFSELGRMSKRVIAQVREVWRNPEQNRASMLNPSRENIIFATSHDILYLPDVKGVVHALAFIQRRRKPYSSYWRLWVGMGRTQT